MNDASTAYLQTLLERINAGQPAARDELIEHAYTRLRRLTRKMFHDYPRLRQFEETDDVFHQALLRLCAALRSVAVASVRAFFGLAARHIRFLLIDLLRHYGGPQTGPIRGAGNPQGDPPADGHETPAYDQADTTHEPFRLAQWSEFHGRVETLPAEEREVFDLLWYQGLKQGEAAEVLGVSHSTVKLRWLAARLRLQAFLQD